MNFPSDRVHHIALSYARLLLPLWGGRWIAWKLAPTAREDGRVLRARGFCILDKHFHNCRDSAPVRGGILLLALGAVIWGALDVAPLRALATAGGGLVLGFIGGARRGWRWGVENERAWDATIRRVREHCGRCETCGNLRAPEPLPRRGA